MIKLLLKISLFSSVILCIHKPDFDQGWEWVNASPTGNHLYEIEAMDTNVAIAVGELNTVLKPINGGITWDVKYHVDSTISNTQTFTKITQGVVVNDSSFSWGCSWGDYDNDGDLDLFVSNLDEDPKDNRLYRNNGNGTFTRFTEGEIVNDGGGSFSSSWGDYDNDGDLDLFVPNIYAGFFAEPNNTLYTNNGDGTFARVSEGITIDATGSTCVSWGDYDNDGYVDLFIAL